MEKLKRRIFNIIQIGNKDDLISRCFDIFISLMIFTNLFVVFFSTYEQSKPYAGLLNEIDLITCVIFAIEYILRLWTANMLYPSKGAVECRLAFVFSFFGIIDLLSFLPFFLPFVFPSGVVAFRMLRVVRIFRLFRVNAQYDAFSIITDVLKEKKNQLFSSMVIIMILMLASSLGMYSLEHDAQPDAFKNAFSGIWWSVSTLLTVGYGDIYPITIFGRILAIIIAFLGVGMVSIPTGIISAGFVEHYSRMRKLAFYAEERDIDFVISDIPESHPFIGKTFKQIIFPPGIIAMLIIRGDEQIIPNGDTKIYVDDKIIFVSANQNEHLDLEFNYKIIKEKNPWIGKKIKEIDISRLELIVMIKRKNKTIVPNGNTQIHKGDELVMYSKK